MSTVNLEHIVYAPVPYKGYSIRARSPNANIELFVKAFKDFLIPFHQEVVVADQFFLERVVSISNNCIYLSRIFHASEKAKLDELSRRGVVAHIVEIPIGHVQEKNLEIRSVDEAMSKCVTDSHVPIGSIEPLSVQIQGAPNREENFIRETFHQEFVKNILSKVSSSDRMRIFMISRRLQKNDLILGLSWLLSQIEQISLLIAPERISGELIPLFNKIIIIGKMLPPWAKTKDWEILNLDKIIEQKTSTLSSKIDEIIDKIYRSK